MTVKSVSAGESLCSGILSASKSKQTTETVDNKISLIKKIITETIGASWTEKVWKPLA